MKLTNIEELIEKYDLGETSLQEEQELSDFFSQNQVPAHLEPYAAQFRYFSNRKHEKAADVLVEEKLLASIEKVQGKQIRKINPIYLNWTIGVAASICFLIIGFMGGRMFPGQEASPESTHMAELKSDVKEMKEMFSMLKQQSASERLKAVNYVRELDEADPKIVAALLKTLNEDDNVNVRLAAARALAGFAAVDSAREGLISSLSKQTDPIIQLALIDIFIDLEEKRAVQQMEKLLEQEETLDVVKIEVEKGLKILM